MFQCATANLGLSEVLFVLGLSGICVCVCVSRGHIIPSLEQQATLELLQSFSPFIILTITNCSRTHTLTPRGTHRADVRA